MLIAQCYLQMQHILSIAHEAECSGLNNTCMDGAYVYLVQRLSLDGVEWIVVHRRVAVAAVKGEAQGLIPRHGVELHVI